MFFTNKPKCSNCEREITKGEKIFLEIQYPYYDGNVRITKFIENEAKIYCKQCSSIVSN